MVRGLKSLKRSKDVYLYYIDNRKISVSFNDHSGRSTAYCVGILCSVLREIYIHIYFIFYYIIDKITLRTLKSLKTSDVK